MTGKNGVNKTDIGCLPSEWNVGSLDEFCQIVDCRHVTAEFVVSGRPVVSIGEVQSRFVDLSSAKRTTDEFYFHLIGGGRKPTPGDLIFSRNATVGEVAQVTASHQPFAMGQDVCLIRKKQKKYSSDYLQSIIQSHVVTDQLENMMVGSTFRRVNVRQIKCLIIPMPKPEEQRAIAEALSDVDALINALDALITKKRYIKQGTMQQLLTGKKRLPGYSGKWEETTFGEAFTFLKSGSNARSDLSDKGEVFYIHYGDIHQKWSCFLDCATSSIPRIDREKVKHLPLVEEGDLIMADASEDTEGIGACIEVQNLKQKMVSGLHTFLLRADKRVFADGFKGYLTSIRSVHFALGCVATGISVYGVSKKNLQNITLPKPPVNEQSAIAEVLSNMDAEITALEQKRDKTKLIKLGMMQELLTGKTRLI